MTFKVTLQPSNNSFDVEEGQSLLDAAINQGIGMPYGCRGGGCGACVSGLVSGEVEYPNGEPPALQGRAKTHCVPCMARVKSDLVLEVKEIATTSEIQARLMPCRVQKVEHLAHDVIRLMLKLPEGQRMQFMAGQYLEFILKNGRRRAFSIANAPHDDEFIELHIRHVDGGVFTDWAFEQLEEKTILRIEAPLGSFVLNEESERPMVFIGGGTGFAPIKGQIEHALKEGVTRPIKLYWGVRSRRDLYLPELPEQWAKEYENVTYVPVLSEPDDDWEGRSGWVHEAVLADLEDITAYDIYMAGPPVMVKSGRDAFLEAGVSEDNMFYDSFEYAADGDKK